MVEGNLYYSNVRDRNDPNNHRDWLPFFPNPLLHEIKILPPVSVTTRPIEDMSPSRLNILATTTTVATCPTTPHAVAITRPLKVCYHSAMCVLRDTR